MGQHRTIMMVDIRQYPQLLAICWNRRSDVPITLETALALYERNWDYVDQSQLTPDEARFIEQLKKTVGNGALGV